MLKAMQIGNHHRTTASTNMNERSSRSHAIFQICIEMASVEKKTVKIGKLNLIDLAGSERQSKSGAVGDRLKEASKINKSLSALGIDNFLCIFIYIISEILSFFQVMLYMLWQKTRVTYHTVIQS